MDMMNNKKELSFIKNIMSIFKLIWKYSHENKFFIILVLFSAIIGTGAQIFGLIIIGNGIEDIMTNLVIYGNNKLMPFVYTIIILCSIYLIQFLCSWLQSFLFVIIGQRIGYFIRYDLAKKLQKLTLKYLDSMNTGDLLSRFTNDVDAVVITFTQSMTQVINAFFTFVGVTISIFLINPILAGISIILLPILFSFIIIFIKISQPYFLKQQTLIGKINGDVEEFIAAHKMTTLFKYKAKVKEIFSKKNEELKGVSYKAQFISGLIYPYNNFINNFIISIITCVQVLLLIFAKNIIEITAIPSLSSPAVIAMLFVSFLRQLTSQISTVFTLFNQFQLTFASLNRINEILNQTNESNKGQSRPIVITKPLVEFKNVNFGYNDDKLILKNISFIAKPNTMNAIVGPTGSGKTTIINLLTRFYDINSGNILIDNKDITKYSRHSIRNNIGIVLQDSFMFSNTIMENIRIGYPNATDNEVIRAAKLANAHKFISKLPNGYNTMISNDADIISQGEKQLISIARSFLAKSKIIILDEATSYVDTKTEKDIQIAMKKLMKNKTSFVIAHRLSTIKDADNIIVIKDGEILESGNHIELMEQNGFYASMNKAMNNDLDKQ